MTSQHLKTEVKILQFYNFNAKKVGIGFSNISLKHLSEILTSKKILVTQTKLPIILLWMLSLSMSIKCYVVLINCNLSRLVMWFDI